MGRELRIRTFLRFLEYVHLRNFWMSWNSWRRLIIVIEIGREWSENGVMKAKAVDVKVEAKDSSDNDKWGLNLLRTTRRVVWNIYRCFLTYNGVMAW